MADYSLGRRSQLSMGWVLGDIQAALLVLLEVLFDVDLDLIQPRLGQKLHSVEAIGRSYRHAWVILLRLSAFVKSGLRGRKLGVNSGVLGEWRVTNRVADLGTVRAGHATVVAPSSNILKVITVPNRLQLYPTLVACPWLTLDIASIVLLYLEEFQVKVSIGFFRRTFGVEESLCLLLDF